MQCASLTVIPMSPLVYTRLQMAFSLQHGLWPTWNVPASISVSTVIRKERFLNDKPLKRSKLILKRRNQWRNSKLCGSWSNSARNEWNYLKFATSHSPWAYSREHSPGQVSALDSHIYFPHQTRNNPFEMIFLTPEWNQKNRHLGN